MRTLKEIIHDIIEGLVAMTAIIVAVGLPIMAIFAVPLLVIVLLIKLILK